MPSWAGSTIFHRCDNNRDNCEEDDIVIIVHACAGNCGGFDDKRQRRPWVLVPPLPGAMAADALGHQRWWTLAWAGFIILHFPKDDRDGHNEDNIVAVLPLVTNSN